jgi:hypothetical protein
MSYCRFGWESSDAYIFGTIHNDENVIVCCGCLLVRTDDAEGYAEFDNYGDLLRHINDHRVAGHHIVEHVEERIRHEIDHPDQRWVEVGVLPETMVPDPGPRHEEDEVFKHARTLLDGP